MRLPTPHTLKQIATIIGSRYVGADDFPVLGLNEIHGVEAGDIVFVDHPKYYDKALSCKATVVLINKEVQRPEGKALLISDDPFRDFNRLIEYFSAFEKSTHSISPSAEIGEDTIIQPNVFIGHHVKIGKGCLIHSNVSIYDDCIIGDHVIIHAGTVLGSDAFYYKRRPDQLDKLISCGRVIIEDEVEIGSLCSIDKGVTGDTTIGKGTKLDNQVQVGHDTQIGQRCQIASQTGIAGCVTIEDEVVIWGQVGIVSAITIGKQAVIMGQSGVGNSLPGGKKYFGSPAGDSREKMRELFHIKQIPDILKKLDE